MELESVYETARGENGILEYSQMIVPSSMRSQYWKYFGFPSDNFSNIITKKKVICSLCSTAISYNKNTTNLRTHLLAKHSDLLYELTNERRRKSDSSSASSEEKKKKISPAKKKGGCLKGSCVKDVQIVRMDDEHLKIAEQDSLIEAITKGDIVENTSPKEQQSSDTNELEDYSSIVPQSFKFVEIDETQPSDENVADALLDMLVKDLIPPSIVNGSGFSNFVWTLRPNATIPHKTVVENQIKKSHDSEFKSLFGTIKTHSDHNRFSLGFEIWENVDKKELLSIYVNYIPQKNDTTFNNVLFKTIEISKNTNLDNVLEGINMTNCSAAISNFENSVVSAFLNSHGVPAIPCFETMIQGCLTSAFKISSVEVVMKEIENFLEKGEEMCETDLVPQVHEEFPVTKFNFLTFFNNKMSSSYSSWTDDVNDLILKAKEILDCLTPLKMTLETLSDEPIALSSLLRPLTTKLLNQHFCLYDDDPQLVLDIKEAVIQELSSNVMTNTFLVLSSFMDPRFQNFTDPECLQIVKDELCSKFETANNDDAIENKEDNNKRIMRMSSLKLFFKGDEIKRRPPILKSTADEEIAKYTREVCADLEQCPLKWWNDYGCSYRQLKAISQGYICVPASLNNIYKRSITDQIEYYNKRFMLRENSGRNLLFLHFNK